MWITPAVWKQYNKMAVLHFFLVNSTLIYILFSLVMYQLLTSDWSLTDTFVLFSNLDYEELFVKTKLQLKGVVDKILKYCPRGHILFTVAKLVPPPFQKCSVAPPSHLYKFSPGSQELFSGFPTIHHPLSFIGPFQTLKSG